MTWWCSASARLANRHYLVRGMGRGGLRFREAEERLREAIRLNPKDALCHDNLGLPSGPGDFDGAEASFREAIQLDPKDATANNHLWELMASRLKATPGLMKLAMRSSST